MGTIADSIAKFCEGQGFQKGFSNAGETILQELRKIQVKIDGNAEKNRVFEKVIEASVARDSIFSELKTEFIHQLEDLANQLHTEVNRINTNTDFIIKSVNFQTNQFQKNQNKSNLHEKNSQKSKSNKNKLNKSLLNIRNSQLSKSVQVNP